MGILFRNNSPNTIIFTPKCLVLMHPPQDPSWCSQCNPCPWRRLQHLEQVPQLQGSNIPQGKTTRAAPSGSRLTAPPRKSIFKAPIKPQTAKLCTQPGAGTCPGHKLQPSSSPEHFQTHPTETPGCGRSHSHTATTLLGNKNQYSFRNLREQPRWKGCHGICG